MTRQSSGGEERAERSLEERVRKVRGLDPFRLALGRDGRFSCHLEKPLDELTPGEARRILRLVEPLLRRLRGRASGTPASESGEPRPDVAG